ncbi:MAG: GGDEF domain-containing protein [Desulfamplus sp.]|nr:GGDEF domain-containing protein [Desulfamplus sp.]
MQKRRKHLMLALGTIVATGFIVTTFASYFVSKISLRDEILHNELPLTSDNIYSEIQRDLLQPIFISSLMASDTFLRDWIIAGEDDESQVIRYLKEIKERYQTVTTFFVSENTKIYYQAQGILKSVSQGDPRDAWYFRLREIPLDYEINVDPDMANMDAMTIFINYKVYDYGGSYIGATGVGMTVSAVKSLINEYQNAYDRTIYFVDQGGNVILSGSGFPGDIKNLSHVQGLDALAPEILSNSENFLHYRKSGASFLLNTRYIPEFQWYLIVEQPEARALKKIVATLLINLGLCTLITAAVLFLTHITLTAYQTRLEQMATLDKLTMIYNRQAFSILFRELLKDVHRRFIPFSVVMIDLDYFKVINDTLGHIAGDAVLKHCVAVIRKELRDSDILCRWGGEEFVVVLKECRLDNAFNLAEKIRKTLGDTPCPWPGGDIPFTASLGVTQWNLLDDRDENSILSRADKALYMAKEGGRNITIIRP